MGAEVVRIHHKLSMHQSRLVDLHPFVPQGWLLHSRHVKKPPGAISLVVGPEALFQNEMTRMSFGFVAGQIVIIGTLCWKT
jgi:hypothetical protein